MASLNLGGHLQEIEAAREEHVQPSFLVTLFQGEPDFALVFPFPSQSQDDSAIGDEFCKKIEAFLRSKVRPEAIERDAKIPDEVIAGLFGLGAFGMKIPREYGGLGLSQTNYNRVLTLVASYCNVLALTLSAHQSIGVSQPLLVVTEGKLGKALSPEARERNRRQRDAYLPRAARQAISAFALTEPSVGSDPANMKIEAVLSGDATHYVVNGDKLWCTNGTIASLVVLIARVPCRRVEDETGETVLVPAPDGIGASERPITAFVVDMQTPGIEVLQRCEFEGCRGIENAHLRFRDVRIPAGNVIGEIGQGLKYALTILNVGRVSVAAICLGIAKQAWLPTLEWARTRTTFSKAVGEHESQTARIGHMATLLFAMEAATWLTSELVDRGDTDARIEAAVSKIFCSEAAIQILKDAQILWGGRGYETADSKRRRGEVAVPIEQLVRDAELYRIGEGATDVLLPFIAREAWSPHLTRVRDALGGTFLGFKNAREASRVLAFYGVWYLRRLIPSSVPLLGLDRRSRMQQRWRYVSLRSRVLARASLRAMAVHRSGLESKQIIVDRLASEGMDLFLIYATASYAELLASEHGITSAWELADAFFRDATLWIAHGNFRYASRITECSGNERTLAVGSRALKGDFDWLARGSVEREYPP